MTCGYSGCNAPEGECLGFCLTKGVPEVQYPIGTKITCRDGGEVFVVAESTATLTKYVGRGTSGECPTDELVAQFWVGDEVGPVASPAPPPGPVPVGGWRQSASVPQPPAPSVLDIQVGGDHYKKLGVHQPWEVLRAWLTPEEFRGYMKGTAIAYLARERDKGGMQDIEKAGHTLQGLRELLGAD